MSWANEEVQKTINDIKRIWDKSDLCFAMLSDTDLSECAEDTCKNIQDIDKDIKFDFIVHLGNFIDGTVPQKKSGYLLKSELNRYKSCIEREKLFVAQGNEDGWRDERFLGQLALSINTDEFWYENTDFIDAYKDVSRPDKKPYYYVDFEENKAKKVMAIRKMRTLIKNMRLMIIYKVCLK